MLACVTSLGNSGSAAGPSKLGLDVGLLTTNISKHRFRRGLKVPPASGTDFNQSGPKKWERSQ